MNGLRLHLLDEILFRLPPKSMGLMRCTNRSINSHISDDPKFEIEYCSRFGSSLLIQPFVIALFPRSQSHRCYILGSCFGLLLVYINGLFIVNPLTKRFQNLDHSGSKLLSKLIGGDLANTKRAIGFAVNRNGTTKRFKIVLIHEMQTMYEFEINDGDSWRISKTTITISSESELIIRTKPVYLDDTLHWLRNDGSIIKFNPETEEARIIPSRFHMEPDMNVLFAADDKMNCLSLISSTREEISVYTLTGNTKWALARQIKNMEKSKLENCWNVVMYNGKILVARETINDLVSMLHEYDMEANSWLVLGPNQGTRSTDLDFYKFTPFFSFVEQKKKEIVDSNDLHASHLTAVMRFINTTM